MSPSFVARVLTAALLAALMQACGGSGEPTAGPALPQNAPQNPQGSKPPPVPPASAPAITPKGEALGFEVARAEIGPAGGRLDLLSDGLSIVVPPGALANTQVISVQPIRNTAPGALGNAWRLLPEGVTFAKPVTIEWRASAAERVGAARLAIASQGTDGAWRIHRASADSDGVLSTQAHHFSDWSKVAGIQLRPGSATVRVNEQLLLTVSYCDNRADPADPLLVDMIYTCGDLEFADVGTGAWRVNGVPGGNAGVGTVTRVDSPSLDGTAVYRAPGSVPAGNPVAVSVSYRDPMKPNEAPLSLVANVTVIDPAAGCGWLQAVSTLDAQLAISYSWAGADPWNTHRKSLAVDVRGRLQRSPLTPIGQVWFEGHLDEGSVKANFLATSNVDGSSAHLVAQGAPVVDGRATMVRVFVALDTCKLILTADSIALGQITRTSAQGGSTELAYGGGSVALSGWPLEGKREFSQEADFASWQNGGDSTRGIFRPWDETANFDGPMGQARVTWSLKPR